MSFAAFTEYEFNTVADYFFARGIDANVAGQQLGYIELVAEQEIKSAFEVFESLKNNSN
jgi:hypothetical protein